MRGLIYYVATLLLCSLAVGIPHPHNGAIQARDSVYDGYLIARAPGLSSETLCC
jgi:hypothetical protein